MSDQQIKVFPETYKTYLAMIKNSVGSGTFQNAYSSIGGESQDLTKGGSLSCGFFVSSLCVILRMIKEVHTTVSGTVSDLQLSAWQVVSEAQAGDILVWEALDGHEHIGFYLGSDKAVSNSTEAGIIAEHHWTYGVENGRPLRAIKQILRYDFKKHDENLLKYLLSIR